MPSLLHLPAPSSPYRETARISHPASSGTPESHAGLQTYQRHQRPGISTAFRVSHDESTFQSAEKDYIQLYAEKLDCVVQKT